MREPPGRSRGQRRRGCRSSSSRHLRAVDDDHVHRDPRLIQPQAPLLSQRGRQQRGVLIAGKATTQQ
jgi:hypothetical protein